MCQMNYTSEECQEGLKKGTETINRQVNFQNLEGQFIKVTAYFERIGGYDKKIGEKVNACVYNINICENIEDHIWLSNVVPFNRDIWKKLKGGEQLFLFGKVYSYSDEDGDKKYSIDLDHKHFGNKNSR